VFISYTNRFYIQQVRQCIYKITLWCVHVTIVAIEIEQYISLLFCWLRCGCQQYKSV